MTDTEREATSGFVCGAIRKATYRDSIELMRISRLLEEQPDVLAVAITMATPANLALLDQNRLNFAESVGAQPDDLIVSVRAKRADVAGAALSLAQRHLDAKVSVAPQIQSIHPARTIAAAAQRLPSATLAVISVPGAFAASEAKKALDLGLDVFLFSDNVPLAEEIELKRAARKRGRLLMGPDCGTAILGGVPIGFANVVRRGSIGLVGASGTGLQQVTSLIDQLGEGVSHAIGVGSHDLSEEVSGLMTEMAIDRLSADPDTRVIVLVSKPPSPGVAARVVVRARATGKPVITCFLGAAADPGSGQAATLDEAAVLAVASARQIPSELLRPTVALSPALCNVADALGARIRKNAGRAHWIRGLFGGGTLAGEAAHVLRHAVGQVAELTEPPATPHAIGHSVIDLGADAFTVGRPHPMIDPRTRIEWILRVAADPAVAVLLFDLVLGFGASKDPAGELLPAVQEAQRIAHADGRTLAMIASICGTALDPQGLVQQKTTLAGGGVLIAPSNAAAAKLAARVMIRAKESR